MNKKIIISLATIGAVAAIAIGGTIAYFSDTETSTGNTFTAGTLDLKIDSTCHYNGNTCNANHVWEGASAYPVPGTSCSCTWVEKDLATGDLFFNFSDVKPGDDGENTISLHANGNDAYVCAIVSGLTNQENGCNEPETSYPDTNCGNPGAGEGELQNYIYLTIWRDNGVQESTGGGITGKCDNVWQDGETVLVPSTPIDSNNGTWKLYSPQTTALAGGSTECLGVAWSISPSAGNNVQGDSVTANISFYAEQARNNPNFNCGVN